MWNTFSHELKTFISKLGFSNNEVSHFTHETRFFHDLGFRGDTAIECMQMLNEMGVDMSNFIFEDYFPAEFHKKFILNLLPIPDKYITNKERFKPLTLAMLEDFLEKKTWN